MTLNIKSIFIDSFMKMFESNLTLTAIIFVVAIVGFTFRHYIAFYFDFTKREKNKFTEITFFVSISILGLTAAYLYIKQYFFLLSIELTFILTYFLYMVGILDMLVEKLEGRYGR